MVIKPKYIQVDCLEKEGLDLRQAEAVLKHKPDIIILEYPNNEKNPSLTFNEYGALEKPKDMVKKKNQKFSDKVLKIHPWAEADTVMWRNIARLWKSGHQCMVYSVDAPSDLTGEWLEVWKNCYPCVKKNWLWWVSFFVRFTIRKV